MFEVGLATIGWPPTIDVAGEDEDGEAGESIISNQEFELIRTALEKERV